MPHAHVTALPHLLSFWTFQEPEGAPRVALGPHPYALRDGGKPVGQAGEGVFGRFSADFTVGSWLQVSAAECPGLDLHGPAAQVTVVAWIKRRRQDPEWCDFIAGRWDEHGRRQYALFLGLGLRGVPSHRQVCGHVSATGGHSQGLTFCDDASSGETPVPYDRWCMIAMTSDGTAIRSYLDGRLDGLSERNPFPYTAGIFAGGADFTVGANSLPEFRRGHPRFDPVTSMGCQYGGLIGGLAVFDRALDESTLARLHRQTLPARAEGD